MSAALKPYVPPPTQQRRRVAHRSGSNRRPVVAKAASSQPSLRTLPIQSQPSRSVQVLAHVRLVSSVLATALVSLSLASYGASVYVDRQINQATRQFNRLQRSEQQLTTVNEVLKNYMAQQAETSNVGLQPPQPDNVIFLKPTDVPPRATPAPTSDSHPFQLPQRQTPLGY